MSKLIPTSLRLPEELLNEYQKLSEKLNIPKTMLMRDGLTEYLQNAKIYEENSVEYALGKKTKDSIDIFDIHDIFKEFILIFEWENSSPKELIKYNDYAKEEFDLEKNNIKDILNIENEVYYEKILADINNKKTLTINKNFLDKNNTQNWYEFNFHLYQKDDLEFLIIKGVNLNQKIEDSFIQDKININRILKDNSQFIYILTDENYRIIETSDYINVLTGYEEKEMFLRPIENFIKQNKNILSEKKKLNLEFITKEGETKKAKMIISKFVENNEIKYLLHGFDITNEKRLELLIKQQRDEIKKLINQNVEQTVQTYQGIIDKIPIAIYYKDLNGNFLGCNRKFEILFGIKNEDIIGKNFDELFKNINYNDILQKESQVNSQNREKDFETVIEDDFGNKKNVHIYLENWSEKSERLGLIGLIMLDEEKVELKNILEAYRATNDYFLNNVIKLKEKEISLNDIFYSKIPNRLKQKIIIDSTINLKDLRVDSVFLTALNIFFEKLVHISEVVRIEIFIENKKLNMSINYKEREDKISNLFKIYIKELLKEKNVNLNMEKDNIYMEYELPEERLLKIKERKVIDYKGKNIVLAMGDLNIPLFKSLIKTGSFITMINSIEELILQINTYNYDKIIIDYDLYITNEYLLKNIDEKIVIISNKYLEKTLKYILYPIDINTIFEG